MCTITFFPKDEHSYIISMNRDELKSRKKALPPRAGSKNRMSFIRPIDGNKGGTWIAVNEKHLSLSIMNWYQAYHKQSDGNNFETRGKIIHELIDKPDLSTCDQKIRELNLQNYQPFRLIGVQTNPMTIKRWHWDGENLQLFDDPVEPQIWISAGIEYEKVYNSRKSVFKDFVDNKNIVSLENVKDLHASEYPERGIYSISMWSDMAQTVSNTIIVTQPDSIKMHYLDGFPADSDNWITKEMDIRHVKTSL
jgi:hypothetical protein